MVGVVSYVVSIDGMKCSVVMVWVCMRLVSSIGLWCVLGGVMISIVL